MAMEFTLTPANLKTFLVLAHKQLWVRPANEKDDAEWCNSFLHLVDSINALLWHDTSDFNPDDMPEGEAATITKYMKGLLEERFFTTESRKNASTRTWADAKVFAEANLDIWTSFIPGYHHPRNLRGKAEEMWHCTASPLQVDDFIVPWVENLYNILRMRTDDSSQCSRYITLYANMVMPIPCASQCLAELALADVDVDESMVDDYFDKHSMMIRLLHQECSQRYISDVLYQVVLVLGCMMITDSVIATASFKLGEYISASGTHLDTDDEPGESVFDPDIDDVVKLGGKLDMDSKIETPHEHKIVTLTRQGIYELIIDVVAEHTNISPDLLKTSNTEIIKAVTAGVAAKLHPNYSNAVNQVLADYLYRRVIEENDESHLAIPNMILDELIALIPRTMARERKADVDWKKDRWVLDLTLCRFIASHMSIFARKIVNVSYAARALGYDPGYEINSREIYADRAQCIVESALTLAFDNLNLRELVEQWFVYNHHDALNMEPGDLATIVLLAIPTGAGTESTMPVEVNFEPRPEMNFPLKTFEPNLPPDDKEDEDDGKDEDGTDVPEPEVTFNFIYDIDGLKIDRFLVERTQLENLLRYASSPDTPECEACDRMVIRLFFPHASGEVANVLVHYFRLLLNTIRDEEILPDPYSKHDAMWAAITMMIPKWGYPDCHWHIDPNCKKGQKVYCFSIDEINRMVTEISAFIFSRWGTVQAQFAPSRPLGAIVEYMRLYFFPSKGMTRFAKVDVGTIKKVQTDFLADLLKAHIYTHLKSRSIGGDLNDFMVKVGLDSDLQDYHISDEGLASSIFMSIAHTIPFDDIEMNTRFSRMSVKQEPAGDVMKPEMRD